MNSTEEILDKQATKQQRRRLFQSMSLLAIIGNSIWGLLFFVLFVACLNNGRIMLAQNESSDYIVFYLIVSGLIVAASILCIIGILMMKRGKKRGFYFYGIGNGIWILLLCYDSTRYGLVFPVLAIISAFFIGYFALRLRKLS